MEMDEWFLVDVPEKSAPRYFNFNGVDSNGDTQVDLYPIPDGAYTINFNPVEFLAYSKALLERGEDSGINSTEAYQLYLQSLSDHIANEANRYPDEITWIGD